MAQWRAAQLSSPLNGRQRSKFTLYLTIFFSSLVAVDDPAPPAPKPLLIAERPPRTMPAFYVYRRCFSAACSPGMSRVHARRGGGRRGPGERRFDNFDKYREFTVSNRPTGFNGSKRGCISRAYICRKRAWTIPPGIFPIYSMKGWTRARVWKKKTGKYIREPSSVLSARRSRCRTQIRRGDSHRNDWLFFLPRLYYFTVRCAPYIQHVCTR